jgi:hypothetical protein
MADIPPYVQGDKEVQANYQEELNQTLIQNFGVNGVVIPSVTTAQLTTNVVLAPDGTLTSLASLMPDGTMWYCNDASPQVYVGKINGSLVKFTTAAFP